ncbi:M20 family metallopeptidase [Burkholderia gladioli]|uniref:M20 aminoacylase family protein n=1 Tax=Burkholderia gladioli TaxID=28095 RepID=UPI001CF5168D|nr:M20 aminoacylase family protein [Burkholderia gladioli]MCA8171606.1 M20 family metallopeptidase [Burkholderia gladioli]
MNRLFSSLTELEPLDEDMRYLRHALHRQPELAFAEEETAREVAARLRDYGYEVHTGIAGTGVVGVLRASGGTRSIGLRADLDALPITEENGFAHASCVPGRMHACGHDGHTAMLMGAARHLARTRRFDGTLNLIFQPAEERGYDSGAKRMVEAGLFERFPCDAVFGMHNHPGQPQGRLMFRAGDFMAAGDRVFITIEGKGGHAARPHQTHDPVVAAAAIVTALQTVVARNVDPSRAAVVTVGMLNGGHAPNVIPHRVQMSLSVRSFDADTRALLRRRIETLVSMQAASFEVEAKIDYVEGYPVVHNHAAETAFAIEVAREVVGEANVEANMEPLMGSEDFAYLLQARPGCFLRIGNGPATGGRVLHSPTYDFNDDNLVVGAAYWSRLVERYLDPARA